MVKPETVAVVALAPAVDILFPGDDVTVYPVTVAPPVGAVHVTTAAAPLACMAETLPGAPGAFAMQVPLAALQVWVPAVQAVPSFCQLSPGCPDTPAQTVGCRPSQPFPAVVQGQPTVFGAVAQMAGATQFPAEHDLPAAQVFPSGALPVTLLQADEPVAHDVIAVLHGIPAGVHVEP